MRDILTVMKFTIKDMIRRKSFIISTLIILLIIVIGMNVPNIMNSLQGEDLGEKIFIVDNENIFEGNLEQLKQADLGYDIQIGNATFDEIKQKIENEEIDSAIMIEKQTDVYVDSFFQTSLSGFSSFLEKEINDIPQALCFALYNYSNSVYNLPDLSKYKCIHIIACGTA